MESMVENTGKLVNRYFAISTFGDQFNMVAEIGEK